MKRLLLTTALLVSSQASAVDELHKRLFTLDTHLDTAIHFGRTGWDFGARHEAKKDVVKLDLPRMSDGNLDGGFFSIFTAQGLLTSEAYADAYRHALKRNSDIDAMLARYTQQISLARSVEDAHRLNQAGLLVAFKSIENSYPLGENLAGLSEFQRYGVRLAGPVHTKANQFADSATDTPRWNGLSPLGQAWVAEMNRLGMVIDASHASDDAFDQMLSLSKTPLLLSHSSARALFNHPRNLDDERIRKLAENGGAICFSTIYQSKIHMGPERSFLFAKVAKIASLSPQEQAQLGHDWHEMDEHDPIWTTNFEQYMAGLLHTIKVAGVDHVCFGADFDGGGGIKGIDNVTELPRITEALKAAGYSDDDLAKMWSGNVLRILGAAERYAKN